MARPATDLASSVGLRPSLEVQLGRHAAVMILATVATVATGAGEWLAFSAAASFLALSRYRATFQSLLPGGFGWADALTGARLTVLILVAAFLPGRDEWVVAAFVFNVTLDAFDGYVARKLRQATLFGAAFDREADALFVLVAYVHFYSGGWLGLWLLLAGTLPYAYRLIASASPVLVAAGHKEELAATLAGLNFLMLVGAAALPAYSTTILVGSVTVVCLSFSVSFWGLYRHAYPLS
jgi:phosphatidylglycerophosphate synthase